MLCFSIARNAVSKCVCEPHAVWSWEWTEVFSCQLHYYQHWLNILILICLTMLPCEERGHFTAGTLIIFSIHYFSCTIFNKRNLALQLCWLWSEFHSFLLRQLVSVCVSLSAVSIGRVKTRLSTLDNPDYSATGCRLHNSQTALGAASVGNRWFMDREIVGSSQLPTHANVIPHSEFVIEELWQSATRGVSTVL